MIRGRLNFVMLGVVACSTLGVAGCSTYELQGLVVEGRPAGVELVDADDPRLARTGVASVDVSVIVDPDRLSRDEVARGSTGPDGWFALPIRETGAGFLIYDIEVQARRFGYITTAEQMRLPSAKKRLLITLSPGKDRGEHDYEDALDRTLRDAEPYLRD